MKGTKGTVVISLATDGGDTRFEEVPATLYGALAVHGGVAFPGEVAVWTGGHVVTHRATGFLIARFDHLRDARQFARDVGEDEVWEKVELPDEAVSLPYLALMDNVQQQAREHGARAAVKKSDAWNLRI